MVKEYSFEVGVFLMRTDDVWCCGEGIVVCGILCRFLRDVVCHVEGIPGDHCSWKMTCCRQKELLVNAIDLGTPNPARSAQATASHTSPKLFLTPT
jgi:hypothetical protein